MMPFVIWKRVSRVQRAPAWSPDLNCGRIDEPVLDRVVLAHDANAREPRIRAVPRRFDPVLECKRRAVLQELVLRVNPVLNSIKRRRAIGCVESGEGWRSRARVALGCAGSSSFAGCQFVPDIIGAIP